MRENTDQKNTRKYGPEKTLYLETFHAVGLFTKVDTCKERAFIVWKVETAQSNKGYMAGPCDLIFFICKKSKSHLFRKENTCKIFEENLSGMFGLL